MTYALFGGRSLHGGGGGELDAPPLQVRQRDVFALAASGDYRAVVCGTGGRTALPAAFRGARRAGVPFLLWASLWAHPRSVAHALGYPALRHIYRSADAVVTYGSHVSAYVSSKGARNVHIAPQAVDNAYWGAPAHRPESRTIPPAWVESEFRALFIGRPVREKGLRVVVRAWRASGLTTPVAALVLVGVESGLARAPAGGAATLDPGQLIAVGSQPAHEVRNFYASADVLIVPSIPTRTFREPWGLVVNEAMNQGLPIIASDAVGAAAGGLVRDGRNGLIVPAGNTRALTASILRLQGDARLRARLGDAARLDVSELTQEAWAEGFADALASVSASRGS